MKKKKAVREGIDASSTQQASYSSNWQALAKATLPVLSFQNQRHEALVKQTPALSTQLDRLLGDIAFTVAPRTKSGHSLRDNSGRIDHLPTSEFEGLRPDPMALARAKDQLVALGFTVIREGRFGLSVRGPAELVADVVGSGLQVMAQPSGQHTRTVASVALSEAGTVLHPEQLFLMPLETGSMRQRIGKDVDDFYFTPPPLYFASPSATPPSVPWNALGSVEVRAGLNIPDDAPTGQGVRVGIIDTGFYPHPYYAAFSIDRIPLPGGASPTVDSDGHGTAILFNLVSVAPDTEVKAFAQSNPPQDALEIAFDEHNCRVISCSWGWDYERVSPVLEATLRALASEDALLFFASGNGHHAWPSSMPEVFSIGGVFYDPVALTIKASSFASGYHSSQYPGRIVPDFCGLCGEPPRGIYIMMPTQPGCTMDRDNGGAAFAPYGHGDDTLQNDGWVGASGTSSATPQLAGVVAIMLEASQARGRVLAAGEIRQLLAETCRGVTIGSNALGISASATVPNACTGHGLVDVSAVLSRMQALGLA